MFKRRPAVPTQQTPDIPCNRKIMYAQYDALKNANAGIDPSKSLEDCEQVRRNTETMIHVLDLLDRLHF